MLTLKKIWLFSIIFTYLIIALFLHTAALLVKPSIRLRLISRWTRLFCFVLRKSLGIRVVLDGKISRCKGVFIVSNHLGYLDGVVLASLFPVVFVSKLQVRSWPIFGWLAQAGGTVFVDRERKLKSIDSVGEIANLLKKGINILLFPEGTSTNGSQMLPFQSIFFQSALNASCPILPITIQYTKVDSFDLNLRSRDRVFWYGQVRFLQHVFGVLALKNIEVRVTIHPLIETSTYAQELESRKSLSEASRQIILKDFAVIK